MQGLQFIQRPTADHIQTNFTDSTSGDEREVGSWSATLHWDNFAEMTNRHVERVIARHAQPDSLARKSFDSLVWGIQYYVEHVVIMSIAHLFASVATTVECLINREWQRAGRVFIHHVAFDTLRSIRNIAIIALVVIFGSVKGEAIYKRIYQHDYKRAYEQDQLAYETGMRADWERDFSQQIRQTEQQTLQSQLTASTAAVEEATTQLRAAIEHIQNLHQAVVACDTIEKLDVLKRQIQGGAQQRGAQAAAAVGAAAGGQAGQPTV